MQPNEKNHGLYRVDEDRLVLHPSPVPLTRIFNEVHASSFEGLSFFAVDMHTFDFRTDKWVELDYPVDLIADMDDRHAMMNNPSRTFILLNNKGFFEGDGELLYWPTKSLGYNSKSGSHSIDRIKNDLYFVDVSANPNA
ncbi:MAG: hypothetical protein M3Q07_08810, partial [Pseudobdellovibrionaceae bacterium]|nr:hypothetical protein [Pseudobdellovibrionaceae bacterium]